MKIRMRFGLGIILSVILCLILSNLAFADAGELAKTRAAIEARGAQWKAGESWVTRLSPEERRTLLGEKTLELGIVEPAGPSLAPAVPPDAIDWRDKDGYNWVTPVKDQQSCGSCVAFGAVATLESLVRIEENLPDLDIDLSEMHLFNCGGGSCNYGWYNSAACSYLQNYGTPDEACWSYQPVDRPCSDTCPDWQSRAVKITNYGYISGIQACATYVAIAPILVAFEVYTDFYYYTGGIYEHTYGEYEGGHAVCIVGYDTTGLVPYWIVKNSWDSFWGEGGFFRIKMGECDIESRSSYWMSGAILPEDPVASASLTPDSAVIPRGGTLGVGVTVTNEIDEAQIIYFATNVTLPNGTIYPPSGYLFGPYKVSLDPYESKSGHLSHTIPGNAPLGTYTYHGYIGKAGVGIINADQFDFEVIQGSAVEGPEDWETMVDRDFDE